MARLPRQKLPQFSPANVRVDLLGAQKQLCRETTATSTGSKMYLELLALVVDTQTFKVMFCLLQLSIACKQNSEAFRHSSRIQKP